MWLYSLEHSLNQIEPNLAPLIEPNVLEQLKAISRFFPDALTNTYGFEYRLASASSKVDFAIHVNKSEAAIVAGCHPTQRLPEIFDHHPAWQQIQQFSAVWADPSSLLHYHINNLWLEFDLENAADLPIPGMLFRPSNIYTSPSIPPKYEWIWKQALPLLLGNTLPTRVETKLIQCLTCLPIPCTVFQVGVMLSRNIQAVRLCLMGAPSQLIPYLAAMGWQGNTQELEASVNALTPYVDGIILSIDVGEQIYRRIGIEGIYLSRYLPCVNGQWQSLLNYLVQTGLCEAQTRDALLQYSGYSLAKAVHERIYVRGLNHIKLLYHPSLPVAAKIYFGVMHQPVSLLSSSLSNKIQSSTVTPNLEPSTLLLAQARSLDSALSDAVTFLLAARNSEGWWTDFHLAAGISDEWVTGYVGTMLSGVSDDRASDDRIQTAMKQSWKLLQTRNHRANQTWGYNRFPPGDADSTGWAIQLAAVMGETDSSRAQQAIRSLLAHQRSEGGFSTYERPEAIRAFIQGAPEQDLTGWCGSHPCVSAAIATIPSGILPPDCRAALQTYLQSTQSAAGGWSAYWWQDPEYSTALAAEAITVDQPGSTRITQAVEWGLSRLTTEGYIATSDHPAGSPFATAWCLRLLLLQPENPQVQSAIHSIVRWLLDQQRSNGSWTASARLRVPFPDDQDPDRFDQWVYHGTIQGSLVFDCACIFTTATVLQALAKFQRYSSQQTDQGFRDAVLA
ncbi:MAG: hypothetical protein JOZ78_21660 [Chroococcidiopsidaceae cyanobacterium CP_BM_ER_R8_30]|nr:hypothetical protein [Chroococcidiopsidaceae cyanobacterium CP_BM_ER_R8_30]